MEDRAVTDVTDVLRRTTKCATTPANPRGRPDEVGSRKEREGRCTTDGRQGFEDANKEETNALKAANGKLGEAVKRFELDNAASGSGGSGGPAVA